MSQRSYQLRRFLLLFILQVCFSDLDGKKWTFTFPESIKVVKRSDVVIPCTFTAPSDHGEGQLIWYQYAIRGYPQIYNEQDPSKVIEEYRGRTSLVGNGTDSCSLKITDVRETGEYYPGINEAINSYKLNNKQMVKVEVTGCVKDSSCRDWKFTIPYIIDTFRGSCVEIPCTFSHPTHVKDSNFFWFLKVDSKYNVIFSNRTSPDVLPKYRGRTSLVGNTEQNCSLRINDVQDTGYYVPGVNEDINSYSAHFGRYIYIYVSDYPPKPSINVTGDMKENMMVTIICSVNHTCASSPPSITWNRVGHKISWRHEELSEGSWRMESEMSFIPSYRDDKSELLCTVTFPNNRTLVQKMTLNIKYGPKNTSISVAERDEAEEGGHVTLECKSSEANPPVTTYKWYKIGTSKTLLDDHGPKITVLNWTSEKYSCSASNGIETADSEVFHFSYESESFFMPLLIGTAAGLVVITLLLIVFGVFYRRKKQSSNPRTDKTTVVQEVISLEEPFYGNVPKQNHTDIPDERYTTSPNSLYENFNNEIQQHNTVSQAKENQEEGLDGILYTSLELQQPTHVPRQPMKIEETEYSVIVH